MTIEGDGDKEVPAEDKVTDNRLVPEGKNVVKDCEFKIETVNGDVQGLGVGTLQAKGLQLQRKEQTQETVIGWERFLHVTSIKVLLVENDDSTRHIVTAFLRNCHYEVIQAANGLQAWKILETRTNKIDLVLSEVVMPCLSGIGLLCKIMSHKTHKNIPVILMSSHDSMGLVFKCLSKGAANFLSSRTGSGSGTQTHVKSKSSEQSGNNSGSYGGADNQKNAPLENGSDDGSDMQSSWTKQAVQIASSQAASPCNQAPERGDSTCAQVICSNAENSAHDEAHMNPSRDCQEEPDNNGKGKPSITGSLRDPELVPKNAIELLVEHLGTNKCGLEIDLNASSLKMDIKKENGIVNHPPSEHHVVTAEVSHPQIVKRELNKVVDASELDNTSTDDSKDSKFYVVELSLKTLRGVGESGITFQDDRNVLRRSELSAFSRYNSSSNLTRTPNEITQSSLIENNLEIAKNNPVHDIEAHMSKKLLPESSRDVVIQHSHQLRNHHHFHNLDQHCTINHDDLSLKKLHVDGPHCASSNILAGSCEGNREYRSLNRSASGNNYGSNGQNGSSNAVYAGVTNGNSDTSGYDSGNTMDSFKLVRAAALTKFRQKRKERCFEKKVRYQNRKKLAEQRPHVRGQFGRHIEKNSPTNTSDE